MTWPPVRAGIGLVLCMSLVQLVQGQGRQTYTVDFVGERALKEQARPKGKEKEPRLAPGPPIGDAAPLPFEITLVSLDRNGYAIGDNAVFEVTLKHVGTAPFAFPWSREMSAVADAPRAQLAHVLLTFTDPVLGRQLVGFDNTLYGAQTVPGTVQMLQPGDVVTVRGGAQWYLSSGYPQRPPAGWVRDLSVKVELQVQGTDKYRPLLHSANDVKIQLRQQ
jgi:hypothetical protein